MSTVLTVKQLQKSFGSFELHDISCDIPKGCITGLIGVDGSGKSTLIKCLINLIRRDSGQVEFWGMDIDDAEQEIKNRVGLVMEGNNFYDNLTLRETKEIIENAYPNWNEMTFQKYWGCRDYHYSSRALLSSLSQKEKLVFSISLALAHDTDLLILDEPFRGFDPVDCSEVLVMLRDFIQNENHSILISSPSGMEISSIVDSFIMLDDGELVFHMDKDHLLESHMLIKGATSLLGNIPVSEFIKLDIGNYGFTGICNDYNKIKPYCADLDLTVERTNIADIMMAYMWRRGNVI